MCSTAPSHAVELPVCIPMHAQAARREASLLITLPCDWMEDLFTALDQVRLLSRVRCQQWAVSGPSPDHKGFVRDYLAYAAEVLHCARWGGAEAVLLAWAGGRAA